jgi:hypothetical protein
MIGATAIIDFAPGLISREPSAWPPFDELRWFHLIFAVLWVTPTILLWRTAVLWTLGRKWLTAIVALIPFAQVIYAKPLWSIQSCQFALFNESSQRIAQFQLGAGTYIWCLVWLWWGLEKWAMKRESDLKKPVVIAGPIAARAAASIGVIPFVAGTFLIVYQWLQDFPKISDPTLAMCIAAVVAITAWVLIWRRVVVWTPEVMQATAMLALLCLGVPLTLLWFLAKWMTSDFGTVFWHALPVIGWGAFMASTIAVWPLRERFARTDGPRCLKCGYSLRGLTATRCPECGDEATLDQLWGVGEQATT